MYHELRARLLMIRGLFEAGKATEAFSRLEKLIRQDPYQDGLEAYVLDLLLDVAARHCHTPEESDRIIGVCKRYASTVRSSADIGMNLLKAGWPAGMAVYRLGNRELPAEWELHGWRRAFELALPMAADIPQNWFEKLNSTDVTDQCVDKLVFKLELQAAAKICAMMGYARIPLPFLSKQAEEHAKAGNDAEALTLFREASDFMGLIDWGRDLIYKGKYDAAEAAYAVAAKL